MRAQSAQEAARRLELDHSTITRRLHRLEKELGARLFERTPAGHLLTPVGQRLLEHLSRRLPARFAGPDPRELLYATCQFIAVSKRDFHHNHFLLTRALVEQQGDTITFDLLGTVLTEFEKNNWFLRATLA